MLDDAMANQRIEKPGATITGAAELQRGRGAVAKPRRGPHLFPDSRGERMIGVKRGIPFGDIADAEIQRAVGHGVQAGRHPGRMLPFTPDQVVTRRTVRDNVGFADHASGDHSQRLENPFLEKVAPRLSRDAVHDDAEQDVAGVAVIPIAAGRKVQL